MTSSLLTRREFMRWTAASAAVGLAGCATNPVSGEKQLMLISERQEIAMDQEHSPVQFSTDYGVCSDDDLNLYIDDVGRSLSDLSHRPEMPYSFRAVNATHANAYAFPGGTIAVTRGLLVRMEDEAELAAVLGHEISHVCWRHTGARMSVATLVSLALAGVSAYAASRDQKAGVISRILGSVAAGALLAHYSREDEREADATGMEYMTRAGYDARGMIGLMEVLESLHDRKPNVLELMFASHPMSSERLATARQSAFTTYHKSADGKRNKEKFMDSTAGLRKMKPALDEMEKGRAAIGEDKNKAAMECFETAVKMAPEDYCARIMAAECCLTRRNLAEGMDYIKAARELDAQEPRSYVVSAMINLERRDFGSAYDDFKTYDARLPGNPNVTYGLGLAAEGKGDRRTAAMHYLEYLKNDKQTKRARYAYGRLVDWGVIKEPEAEEDEA